MAYIHVRTRIRPGKRVDNLGANVDAWYNSPNSGGNGTSTWDVCSTCVEQLDRNPHAFDAKLQPYNGDPSGEDGRGGDVEHPPYEDWDHFCAVCHVLLIDE